MHESQDITVSDAVLSAFNESADAVVKIFGLKDRKRLGPYIKIVSAMRGLTGQARTDIAIPLITGYMESMRVNPDSDAGRHLAAEFSDSIALLLSDATQMIYQEMQRQQTQQNNFAIGRADKLIK